MADYFDALETRLNAERERDLYERLPGIIAHAIDHAPGWRAHLSGVDSGSITSARALASLPVLRKPELMEMQRKDPPFGGFSTVGAEKFGRIFLSPGPIWEPQPEGGDGWNAARALYAAGFRAGDIVHNGLGYHRTPGGFILDQGAIALGCAVFPAGPGDSETQVEAMNILRPSGYVGTPDYLKVLLDKADERGVDLSCVKKALVSGGALFASLRAEYQSRGIRVFQAYATADLGVIAYESEAMQGMIINEDYLVEIVKPGTNEPLADGEVGEVVVTAFKKNYPLIRFGTGDMSAVMEGVSPCGRTNRRLKGWMGRADQRTKVQGMFIDPAQVAALSKAIPELGRLRLEVIRENEQDHMILRAESAVRDQDFHNKVEAAMFTHFRLKVTLCLVAPHSLPNDGKLIADERVY